jgi:hypothetical protein
MLRQGTLQPVSTFCRALSDLRTPLLSLDLTGSEEGWAVSRNLGLLASWLVESLCR